MKKSELRQIIREEIQKLNEDWWGTLSREEQRAYVEKHPKSKYAKMVSKKGNDTDEYTVKTYPSSGGKVNVVVYDANNKEHRRYKVSLGTW